MNMQSEIASKKIKKMESRYAFPLNWLKYLKTYTRVWRQKEGRRVIVLELAGDLKDKKILDAGCGDGLYTKFLIDAGANIITGTDWSENALRFAHAMAPRAEFVQADIRKTPFADKSFDLIIFLETLEHIPPDDVQLPIRELYRILKPDGRLVVSVPSTNLKIGIEKNSAHFQHFTASSLEHTFAHHFALQKIIGQDYCSPIITFLSKTFENRWFLVHPLAKFFNGYCYMRFWNHAPLRRAGHLIAVFTPLPRT